MSIYRLGEHIPVVDPSAYVHPSAVLIGDVIIGANCYVAPNAVLRGDFGRLILERGANLQDTCVMHAFPDKDCIIRENGHIGHGAVLHGCIIGVNSLVGMNAVVMDDSIIAENCLVAACSFVPAGTVCEPRSLLAGSPAKLKRMLSDDEIAWKTQGTQEYQMLARQCMQHIQEVEPLSEPQPNRPRVVMSDYKTKKNSRP